MAKTHGTKALPLPTSLIIGLTNLGFREMSEPEMASRWRNHKARDLFLVVVSSNIAGSTDMVIAEWKDHRADRVSVDTVLASLEAQVKAAAVPNRFTSRVPE